MTERYDRFVHKEIRGTQTEEDTGRTVTDEILAASVIVVSVGSCQNGS
jgi:hypothetical protein